jgi:hypothetical protein
MLVNFKDDKYKKKILCFLDASHRVELFYHLAQNNQDILFVLCSIMHDFKNVFFRNKISKLPNITIAAPRQEVLVKSKAFGLHITTFSQSTVSHLEGLKFVAMFNKLKVPVFELQHGMFQIGLHYHSLLKWFNSESFPIEGYADKILTYYPSGIENEISVGYPIFDNLKKPIEGDYTLVLSNLHWQCYSKIDVYKFYHAVIKFAAHNPDKIFMWQPHPGEVAFGGLNSMFLKNLFTIYPAAKKNFISIKSNQVSNLVPTEEWIRKSGCVISTVSTVLLDCEMYNKPTLVWESESTKVLLDKIKTKTTFADYDTLCKVYDLPYEKLKLKSGLLFPYDNNVFRAAVEKYYKEPQMDENSLQEILKHIADIKNANYFHELKSQLCDIAKKSNMLK